MSSVTVSAKIPKTLKERLEQYGIRLSEVVRRALEEEVSRAEEERLRSQLERVSTGLGKKVKEADVVSAVRSSREGR